MYDTGKKVSTGNSKRDSHKTERDGKTSVKDLCPHGLKAMKGCLSEATSPFTSCLFISSLLMRQNLKHDTSKDSPLLRLLQQVQLFCVCSARNIFLFRLN